MCTINACDIDMSDDEDDLKYLGTFVSDQSKENIGMPYLTSDFKQIPSLLATPPQSPPDIEYHPQLHTQFHSATVFGNSIGHDPGPQLPEQDSQQKNNDMPTVRAIFSGNNVGNPSTNFNVQVSCFLCQVPFNNIESLRQHLGAHAADLMSLNNPATSVLTPTSVPVLNYPPIPPPNYPLLTPPSYSPSYLPSYPPLPPSDYRQVPPPDYRQILPQVPPPSYPAFSPPAVPQDYTLSPPLSSPDLQPAETGIENPVGFRCATCHKQLNSRISLILHERSHHKDSSFPVVPVTSMQNKRTRRPFKCSICKKGYKRERNLTKHILILHGLGSSQLIRQIPPEQPANPIPDDDDDSARRIVWSTNLLNAVAAADYCPAREKSDKYLAPTVSGSCQMGMNSMLNQPPKQKYALRSPYCNPYVVFSINRWDCFGFNVFSFFSNLWVDYDDHVP